LTITLISCLFRQRLAAISRGEVEKFCIVYPVICSAPNVYQQCRQAVKKGEKASPQSGERREEITVALSRVGRYLALFRSTARNSCLLGASQTAGLAAGSAPESTNPVSALVQQSKPAAAQDVLSCQCFTPPKSGQQGDKLFHIHGLHKIMVEARVK
jgi:hypothetical protein